MAYVKEKEETGSSLQFLNGGGEMGACIREFDWQKTPLGPPAAWPLSLKTAVGIMLNCQVAMYIAWGPTFVQLYNDAYRPLLGTEKHPGALGNVTPETWHEIWDFMGPLFKRIMEGGEAVGFKNQVLMMLRNGFKEECYFSFSYSPLTNEAGQTTGVMATAWETSNEIFKSYYADAIRQFSSSLAGADKFDEVIQSLYELVAARSSEVPYVLWYEHQQETGSLALVAAVGVHPASGSVPSQLNSRLFEYSQDPSQTSQRGALVDVSHHFISLRPADQELTPLKHFVQPLGTGLPGYRSGHLVFAVNPQRPVRDYTLNFYKDFAQLLENAQARITKSQRDMQQTERYLFDAINHLPTMAWITDTRGNVTFYNNAWVNFRGTSLDREIDQGWQEGVHPDDVDGIVAELQRCVNNRCNYSYEYRMQNAEGEYRWLWDNGAPHYTPHGDFAGLIGTSLDITPRRNAEESHRASETKFQKLSDELTKIVNQSLDIICTVDNQGCYTTISAACRAILGYDPEELTGKPFFEFMNEESIQESAQHFSQLKTGIDLKNFVVSHRRKDGAPAHIMWSSTWSDEDQLAYCVGRDVTSSLRLEAIKKAQQVVLEKAAAGAGTRQVFAAACDQISTLFPGTTCGFHMLSEDGATLNSEVMPPFPAHVIKLLSCIPVTENGGSCGAAVRDQQTVIIPHLASDARFDDYKSLIEDAGVYACWSTPIFDGNGNVLGTISVYSFQARNPSGDELSLLDACAKIVGLAIERQKSFKQLTLLETCVARLNDAVVITEADPLDEPGPRIVFVNDAFERQTGYAAREVVGLNPRFLQGPKTQQHELSRIRKALNNRQPVRAEIINYKKTGEEFWVEMEIVPLINEQGAGSHFVAVQRDVSERKAAENQIQYMAFYDSLTGLPNRQLMIDRLGQAIAALSHSDHTYGVLYIDLDNFKTLNEALGHDVGDLLLKEVAKRLVSCVESTDTVARFGGDEFVILLADLSTDINSAAAAARKTGEMIIASLATPFLLKNYELHSSPSIGIALVSNASDSVENILKQADLAMYQAKASGKNTIRFFDEDMQHRANSRVQLESEIRRALIDSQFQLHYQPQVDIEGHIFGVEALIRWIHPTKGIISPAVFIPIAEETGLIASIGKWVTEEACHQLRKWADNPTTRHLSVAVNVSPYQFHQPDFVSHTLQTLEKSGADARLLKLELTESVLVENMDETIAKMNHLKSHNLNFSLDDFGTGYSSLTYLKRLPLDQLKMDQSFVRDVMAATNDAAIARTIISLAGNLGLRVIAEGVETREQFDFLVNSGCRAFQGYLFGRPVPAREFEQSLQSGAGRPSPLASDR